MKKQNGLPLGTGGYAQIYNFSDLRAFGASTGGTTASGRFLPVVTLRDFSISATCYADPTGRVRPGAVIVQPGEIILHKDNCEATMYEYTVRAGHGSSELLVEFKARASDTDFRTALEAALSPLGIELVWDGQYLSSASTTVPKPLGNAFVESDQWDFVWGHSFGR
jgi:hypothetical protein